MKIALITDDGQIVYEIPEEVKTMLTVDFYVEFVKQLNKLHTEIKLEDRTYWNFYSWEESTCGWADAFKTACLNLNKQDLLDYYEPLPWYDSDIFDNLLNLLMIKDGIIKEGICEEDEYCEDDCDKCGGCPKQ